MKNRKPFFARFLEKQDLEMVNGAGKGGPPRVTLKYPSDDDEGGVIMRHYVTLKYPSDKDEASTS